MPDNAEQLATGSDGDRPLDSHRTPLTPPPGCIPRGQRISQNLAKRPCSHWRLSQSVIGGISSFLARWPCKGAKHVKRPSGTSEVSCGTDNDQGGGLVNPILLYTWRYQACYGLRPRSLPKLYVHVARLAPERPKALLRSSSHACLRRRRALPGRGILRRGKCQGSNSQQVKQGAAYLLRRCHPAENSWDGNIPAPYPDGTLRAHVRHHPQSPVHGLRCRIVSFVAH